MKLKPEDILQINVVNWFKFNYPEYADDLIHIANQRTCSVQEGRILKRMGVTRGVSDLFLSVPNNDYHGLWLELKTDKGVVSREQKEFINRKRMRGYCAMVAYSEEESQEILEIYIKNIDND